MASTTGHTLKAFDEDLDQLRATIAEMGGLAEAAINASMKALTRRDTEAARKIVEADRRLDQLEAEAERQAVQIIALRAPMAGISDSGFISPASSTTVTRLAIFLA